MAAMLISAQGAFNFFLGDPTKIEFTCSASGRLYASTSASMSADVEFDSCGYKDVIKATYNAKDKSITFETTDRSFLMK